MNEALREKDDETARSQKIMQEKLMEKINKADEERESMKATLKQLNETKERELEEVRKQLDAERQRGIDRQREISNINASLEGLRQRYGNYVAKLCKAKRLLIVRQCGQYGPFTARIVHEWHVEGLLLLRQWHHGHRISLYPIYEAYDRSNGCYYDGGKWQGFRWILCCSRESKHFRWNYLHQTISR
jgi:hypothetical protein